MPYATSSQFLERYDRRRVGELCRDNNTSATTGEIVSPDAVVLAMLNDASGMIDSAVRAGRRYSTSDLAALPTNSNYLLVRLCCDLAYGLLVARRGYNATDQFAMSPLYTAALQTLEQLRNGERVFVTDGAMDAGLPTTAVIGRDINHITAEASRHFGVLDTNPNQDY